MAVAHDSTSESHTGVTGSTSEASFTWTHTPVGTLAGFLLFVFNISVDANIVSSVTFGGSAVPLVTGGEASDTTTEAGRCSAYFLGSSIPAGAQSVVVNRTNNTNILYAVAVGVTATGDTSIHLAGIVLVQDDGTYAEQNVDDGSPGSNSVRYAGAYSGLSDSPGTGANSTALHSIDVGTRTAAAVRETTAGQGSRPVGFSTVSTDDRAAVHLAVRETAPSATEDPYPYIGGGYYPVEG